MEFLKANQLKTKFEGRGSFYNLEMGGNFFECRNYAEVYRKDLRNGQSYDAIFVLANPGLCSPIKSSYEIPQVSVIDSPLNYTLSKTDNTQYQIMRFMELKEWKNVLLLNLSDIRAGNLMNFDKN